MMRGRDGEFSLDIGAFELGATVDTKQKQTDFVRVHSKRFHEWIARAYEDC